MKSIEIVDSVNQMQQDGLNYQEISNMTGISRHTVTSILKRHCLPIITEVPEPPPIFDNGTTSSRLPYCPEPTICPQCRATVYLPEDLEICWACYVRDNK